MNHFAAFRHGALTVLEPLTEVARVFLKSLGFKLGAVALAYGDFKELRFEAKRAGFWIEVAS